MWLLVQRSSLKQKKNRKCKIVSCTSPAHNIFTTKNGNSDASLMDATQKEIVTIKYRYPPTDPCSSTPHNREGTQSEPRGEGGGWTQEQRLACTLHTESWCVQSLFLVGCLVTVLFSFPLDMFMCKIINTLVV